MKSLEVSRTARNSSQSVCVWVDLYLGFVGLQFMRKYLDIWELQRTTTIH
jgi:hypothetical protein